MTPQELKYFFTTDHDATNEVMDADTQDLSLLSGLGRQHVLLQRIVKLKDMGVIRNFAIIFGAFLSTTFGFLSNAHARPQPHFQVIERYNGETFLFRRKEKILSKLPKDVSSQVMGTKGTCEIVFIYDQLEVIGVTAWTWNGRFVLKVNDAVYGETHKNRLVRIVEVKGGKYQLSDAKWRALIGELPVTKYGKPIEYRFPIWPIIIGPVILYKLLRRFVFHTKKERLKILELDHRYQQAMKILFGNEEEDETLVTGLDDERYTSARNKLIEQGIRPKKVDANLQFLAQTKLNENKRRISDDFCSGEQLEKRQKWDDCVELYSELLKLIPLDDDRRPNAEERLEIALRKLAESQPASSCETSSPASKADELDAAAEA